MGHPHRLPTTAHGHDRRHPAAGTDPDRACFTSALAAARTQITLAHNITATGPGAIDTAVPHNPLPDRRPRTSARKVKSPISRYHSWHGQARPATTTTIEHIQITLHERTDTPPQLPTADTDQPTTHSNCPDTPATHDTAEETGDPSGRYQLALAVKTNPTQAWHARDIAHHLSIRNLNSFRVQMSRWSHRGLIKKLGPASYTLIT